MNFICFCVGFHFCIPYFTTFLRLVLQKIYQVNVVFGGGVSENEALVKKFTYKYL